MTATRSESQISLDFERTVIAAPALRLVGMVRGNDPLESQGAAAKARAHQSAIQRAILTILASEGAMTAKELECRIEFRSAGASSVRKRCSELRQANLIRQVTIDGVGQRRNGCAVMDIAP